MANTEPSSSKTIGLENKTAIDMQAKKKKRPREKKIILLFFCRCQLTLFTESNGVTYLRQRQKMGTKDFVSSQADLLV